MRALVLVVLLASTAHASKPIPWTMKGCVVDGAFYSVDKDGARGVHTIHGKTLDTSKLEGKYIEVSGLLYPGDFFAPDVAAPAAKRACTAAEKKLVQYAKAHDLRMRAGRVASEGKLDDALKLVEASIKLVQPAECDTFIDRAHLLARKDDFAAAGRDIALLEKRKGCRFRGQLNWLLLQDLGNELRQRGNAKLAVAALVLAQRYCTTDLCKPDVEKDLAAARAAAKK